MATSRVNFGEWLPDQPGVVGALTNAKNVYPKAVGYGPVQASASYSGEASENLNNVFSAKEQDGTTRIFASGSTLLYLMNNTTLALEDVSATTYTETPDRWRFTQFGNYVVAANGANTLQYYDLTTTGDFQVLSADAPIASYLTVVRDFVVTGNQPDNDFRVQWSGINNPNTWTSSSVTQSDFQDIPDGGKIQGITGGEFGLVLLENSIVRMSYVGTPLVFQFDTIMRNLGCYEPNSVVQFQNVTYFLSDDGFYACDGQQVVNIGAEKVNRFFFEDVNPGQFTKMSATVDLSKNLVVWGYLDNSEIYKNLFYHIPTKRWSYAETTVDRIAVLSTPDATLETLDTYSVSLDALDTSLDSRIWLGGKNIYGGVKDNKVITFTGALRSAVIDTSDIETGMNKSMITLARPIVDNGSGAVAIATRSILNETVEFGTSTAADTENRVGIRSLGRYHRLRLEPSGIWTTAIGVDLEIQPAGMR